MSKLLTKDKFNELSLRRDGYHCIFCSETNVVIHHIFDRKLFPDNGFYLNNGATVCDKHHWDCEKTDISVDEVKKACGIQELVLPSGFDSIKTYDKWGNIILPNGRRQPGIMFYGDNVQKVLKDKLWLFDLQ